MLVKEEFNSKPQLSNGAIRVTPYRKHHFFGYYDRSPWDLGDRYLLSLETDIINRVPTTVDAAGIGIVDFANDFAYRIIAETHAWNFQEGAKLQWVNGFGEPAFIHNDRRGSRLISVVRNLEGKELRSFPDTVYHVSDDGRKAITLNYARLARKVAGYGYVGIPDPTMGELAPERDGIRLLSLNEERVDLILSLADLAKYHPTNSMVNAEHWVMHLLFNPSGNRVAFIHRWVSQEHLVVQQSFARWRVRFRNLWLIRFIWLVLRSFLDKAVTRALSSYESRLFVMNTDGQSLTCLADDSMVSHYSWRDDDHLLCWARRQPQGDKYWLFNVRTCEAKPIGEGLLKADGHCTYRQDGRWILTDGYPDENLSQPLILYDTMSSKRFDLGQYSTSSEIVGTHFRCDLHPRFNHQGNIVSFDSTHEGARQIYVIDVSHIVQPPSNLTHKSYK